MSGRAWGWVAGAVIALALPACAGGEDAAARAAAEAEACTQEVGVLVAQLQAHVDRYDGVDPLTFATDPTASPAFDLPNALTVHQARLTQLACDRDQAAAELATAMDGLRADGAVASSIAEVLRNTVAGTADGADTGGQRIEVGLDDDLASLALSASPGSVLALAPGEHQVEEPVLVAQRLTIVGQGPEATTVVSTADETALLVAGSGALELSGLTLAHDGGPTSAVVLVLSPWYHVHDVVVTGARADDEGTGGAGVLLAQGPTFGPSQVDVAGLDGRLERIEVHDNAGPGIAIQGDAAPQIVDAEVDDNGPCGVCYLGSAGGSLTDGLVRGNEVGVLVGDTSDPQITRTRVQDNRTDGIVVEDQARGIYRDLEVAGNADRGVIVTGQAAPMFEDSVVRDNGEVGIALIATADAALARIRLRGHTVGLWVGDDAVVSVTDSEFDGYEEAAILLRDAARGTGHGNRCRGDSLGVVTADAAVTELEGSGCEHQPSPA